MFGMDTLATRRALIGRASRFFKPSHAMVWASGLAVLLAALPSAVLSGPANAQDYHFETIAGGYLGDGQAATQAGLSTPRGIAFDAAGNLYIAQANENRIRKVTPGGIISTFAGTGAYGFAGDGGPAAQAAFRSPRSIAIDAAGNVYVSDANNNRVRKITTAGVISTVAGSGADASDGDGGLAVNAGVRRPHGMAFDAAGNLYIADGLGYRVRKVTPAGMISTVAGNGVAGHAGDNGAAIEANLNEPSGVAFDAAGNMYISEIQNSDVRRVDPAGTITTVATDIFWPFGIAVGPDDKVYVSDTDCFIRRLEPGGGITNITGGAGTCETGGDGGPAAQATITTPEGIAFDAAGNLHFVDSDSYIVRKIAAGTISTVVGRGRFFGDGGAAVNAMMASAQGVAVGADGNVYVSDSHPNNRMRKVSPTGIISTFAGTGEIDGVSGDGGPATAARILLPRGVMLDSTGNLYISERGNRVRKVGTNGIIQGFAGGGDGGDGVPATSARLVRPSRTAIDSLGNVYIADTNNHRIRKVDSAGIISTIAGIGTSGFSGDGGPAIDARLSSPTAVALDAAGNVYIADTDYARIRKITPDGIINTIAGNSGNGPPTGDGGPATEAVINRPLGLALDAAGNLYIAGTELRKVTPAGIISTIAEMTHFAYDVTIDNKGAIYVATLGGRVLRSGPKQAQLSDYNGDQTSDILWRNTATGANGYWGSGSQAKPRNLAAIPDQKWAVAGNGDFNADGRADVLWRNDTTGQSTLWFSGESTAYQKLTTITDLSWKIAGIGDFDGDGWSDLLWRHIGNGSNALWRGGNSAEQIPVTGVTSQAWKVAGVGDFDGDGKSDILWHNTVSGASVIWKTGSYALAQNLVTVTDLRWKIVGVGDFNGDGKSDILWHNGTTGANAFWKSGLQSQNLTTVTDPAWQIVAVGDYDADGKSDLMWRHASSGRNAIWKGGDIANQIPVATLADMKWQVTK